MMLFKNWIFRNFSCFQNFQCLIIMLKTRYRKLTSLIFVFWFKKKSKFFIVFWIFLSVFMFLSFKMIFSSFFSSIVLKRIFFYLICNSRFNDCFCIICMSGLIFFFDENFFVFVEFSVFVLSDFRNVLIFIFLVRVQNFVLKKILFNNFWIRFADSSLFKDFFSYILMYLDLFCLKYFFVFFLTFFVFIWLWTFRTIFSLIQIRMSKFFNMFSFWRIKVVNTN